MAIVLKRPIITEKGMSLAESRQYVFEVDTRSTKPQIKDAVEDMFEVVVRNVRTLKVKGKVKRRFTKQGLQVGRTSTYKKAYVTLAEGHEIELVSGAQE
ncbi:MAG: 50S ribosomal protein L23 [Ignavibacteriae bacterium HGW-Ignavibacteriae-4]|jgi:large subunit ribosomal protein L23|nr:MAG: 50S ribosomal protein L23 [Ignavibacteriae bacterium HGW-Ignavibacteriae-4]